MCIQLHIRASCPSIREPGITMNEAQSFTPNPRRLHPPAIFSGLFSAIVFALLL
jgi:hypothetical protein